MNDTFKVGDKIVPINPRESGGCGTLENEMRRERVAYVTILRIDSDGNYIGRWIAYDKQDQAITESCCGIRITAYKKVSSTGVMNKLKTLAKKLFDADTKAMVEVGYLTDSLELTEAGKEVIFAQFLLIPANKKAVADEARAVLTEQAQK